MSLPRSVELLRELVAIPSVNPMGRSDLDPEITGETRYAEHVDRHLVRLGVDSELIGRGSRQSVVARIDAHDAIDTVLVASHLDTVPVDGMSIAPFDPAIRDGRLYGRGSCDTKAGMAALLAALERVLEQGTLRRNVILVGEADEEMASYGVHEVLGHLPARPADWALVTEPTDLRLVTRHKGRITLELFARGRACHASEPTQGANAIVPIAQSVLALSGLAERLRERVDPILGPGTLAITVVSGGHAPNIVPDAAHLIADRRILPRESLASVRAEIEDTLRAAGLADRVELRTCVVDKEPLELDDAAPAVQHCQAALAACALARETTCAAFATDAGPFAAAGLPSIVLGPGSIQQAHTADEWIELTQVETMTELLVALLSGAPVR